MTPNGMHLLQRVRRPHDVLADRSSSQPRDINLSPWLSKLLQRECDTYPEDDAYAT